MAATSEVLKWLVTKNTAGRQLNVAEIGQLKPKLLTKLQAVSVQVPGAALNTTTLPYSGEFGYNGVSCPLSFLGKRQGVTPPWKRQQ